MYICALSNCRSIIAIHQSMMNEKPRGGLESAESVVEICSRKQSL